MGPTDKAARSASQETRCSRGSILWRPCGATHSRSWTNSELSVAPTTPGPGRPVELGGFEPPTPSLRKMRSKRSDQEF
jgi:hypothetical protein